MRNNWQVATAAESFAAAQFSRFGWDISVQYGANQPEYDLVAVNGIQTLKISVKGSKDGGWGLTQSYKKGRSYHQAIETWLSRHSANTILCLVQFQGVQLNELPRKYLARPKEIAEWLKAAAAGRGDTILYEYHAWTNRAQAAGTIDKIPESWGFTATRLIELVQHA
jgi:hypothetical protein